MTTYKEIVSKVVNVLKVNNKDERISKRFILKVLQDTTTQLISQKWLDRTILNEINLYTRIPCFEFKKIETRECPSIEFRLCKTLMKSKKPLPKLIFSRLGSSIKEIVSLDGDYRFILVDESQYRRNKKRQFQIKNEVYIYLGSDNHLYIPDYEIYSLDLDILTLKQEEVENCSGCKIKECKSNWDYPFICPDKLIDVVFNQTLQVLGLTRQIRDDQNPNSIEGA